MEIVEQATQTALVFYVAFAPSAPRVAVPLDVPSVSLTSNRSSVTVTNPSALLTGSASTSLPANYHLALYDNGAYLQVCASTCSVTVSPPPAETHTYTEIAAYGKPPATLAPLLTGPNVEATSVTIGPDATLDAVIDRILNHSKPQRDEAIEPIVAQQAAQQCLDEMIAAGYDEKKCLSSTVFFPGADAGRAAYNDYRTIFIGDSDLATQNGGALDGLAHPEYAQLHVLRNRTINDPGKVSPLSDRWYNAYEPCSSGVPGDNLDCDEFPFYKTNEAGPSQASILLSPWTWIRAEGNRLGQMYATPGCGSSATVGMATSDPFLVVPLVHTDPGQDATTVVAGPPTFFVCAHA